MRTRSILAAAMLIAGAWCAGAPPAPKPPGDGTTRAVSTQRFVQLAMASNRFEIETSELALAKARDDRVKQFARMVLDEHKAADGDVSARAQAAGVSADKAPLEKSEATVIDDLRKAVGPDFDRAYARAQLDAHAKAVALFSSYADAGEDVGLRALAQRLLPTLEQHLEAARSLEQAMKG
jgi:putative membrane protein